MDSSIAHQRPTSLDDVTREPEPAEGSRAGHPSPFLSGQIIGGRYHVIRILGMGGMGAVYQAWDNRLGVTVALKIILKPRDDDAQAAEALERRFKRELLLARQVTHKNVVRIHDFGEVDGTSYITMPYVQGSTLSGLLAREGRLSVGRTLQIAKQVASGLAAAHEAGVVHRDLKPANIMVEGDDDHALIMDFGIARSTAGTTVASGTGGIVGTLAYMAPEQGKAGAVDHRSDIYSFGLIVYDLLTGGRQSGPSAVADLMDRIQKPLPPIRSINPDVPEALERIVGRCLERDPAARYQTVADLVAALDGLDARGHLRLAGTARRVGGARLAGAVALLLAAVVAAVMFRRGTGDVAPPPHQPVSVLIADFDNRANDPVFDGTIEQALTIGVEGASFISAYPSRDAHRLAVRLPGGKLDEKTAQLISVREGVKFVMAGSVEGGPSGYTISTRLIDPAVGKTLKSAVVRAKTKGDVLQAVGTLATTARRDLGDTTPESVRRAASETFTAASLDAVREYTLAQDLANNSKDEEAILHYKRAVDADPQFGRAYSGWATSAFHLGRHGEADELWKKALSLMDRMTERERYRTLGSYNLGVSRNYQQAVDTYSKLVELYPSDRAGHSNLALAYFQLLNFAKAREEGRKAVEIYRGSLKFRNNNALYAMYASDFNTALTGARQLLTEDATFTDAYLPIAISLLATGDRAGAGEAYSRMAKTGPGGESLAAMGVADLAMYERRFANAGQTLAKAVVGDENDRNTIGQASKYAALAEAYQALGKSPLALDAARKALGVTHLESVAVPVARVFLAAGRIAEARALSTELSNNLQPQTRAYARIIDGEAALQQGHVTEAVDAFRAASRLLDVWLAHFDLGVAYVQSGHFAEALTEFEICGKRRGEATALFLDDVPSSRYLAPLPYWLGRAQQGVGMSGPAAEAYRTYLSSGSEALNDRLADDAKRRLALP